MILRAYISRYERLINPANRMEGACGGSLIDCIGKGNLWLFSPLTAHVDYMYNIYVYRATPDASEIYTNRW